MFGSMKEKVAKNLIGKWLKNIQLEEGEINSALVMYQEGKGNNEAIYLLVVGLAVKDGVLCVNRVIQHVNIDEAI